MAVSDGAITEIERNEKGEPTGLAFSPDSRWLAYSAAEGAEKLRSIRLADLDSGAIAPVTTARFLDSDPSFSPDGKYLYFLSVRTFDPVYDAHVFDLAFPLATLRPRTRRPGHRRAGRGHRHACCTASLATGVVRVGRAGCGRSAD
jgi:tricorn protease